MPVKNSSLTLKEIKFKYFGFGMSRIWDKNRKANQKIVFCKAANRNTGFQTIERYLSW